jgi:hypothetical protein
MDVWVGANAVSGMPVTPTATLAAGNLIYQLQDRVLGTERTEGLNHSFVFGLSSFSELGMRTADNTTGRNMYIVGSGLRDLSASAKLQFNPLLGFESSNFKLAAGVTDYGGAATNFRSYYGVATYDKPSWSASAGYAKAKTNSDFNPLNGAFANAAVKVTPWLSARLESNQKHAWAGLTLSNQSLLALVNAPVGASLYLNLDKQFKGAPISGGRPWLGVGIQFPLDWTQSTPPANPSLKQAETIRTNAATASPISPLLEAAPNNAQIALPHNAPELPELGRQDVFQKVANSFSKMGFEGVHVGMQNDQLVIKFSDFVFDHGALDGVGVGLGLISKSEPALRQLGLINYHLIYARWGTPSMAFKGSIQCLSQWLKALGCSSQEAVSPIFRNLEQGLQSVDWKVVNYNAYQYKPRVLLNPTYNYYWATEYSLLDYSLGLNIKPMIHLWDGGVLELSRSEHLQSSQEFKPGGFYSYTRIPNANRRVMLHHIQKIKDGFSARLSVGELFAGPHRGGQLALRWDSLNGEWATGLNASSWRATNTGANYQGLPSGSPKVLFGRYAPTGKDWTLEVQAGEYWYKDKGLSVVSTHWYGDTNFSYFVRRSVPPEQFWQGKKGVTLAGIEMTIPFTPRKAMNADGFQIKGVSRIGLGLVTPIGRPDNYIVGSNGVPIYIKALVDTPVPAYMGAVLFDSDRANAGYVSSHLSRIRYAYQRWVENAE